MAYRTSLPLHPTEGNGPKKVKRFVTHEDRLTGHMRLPGQKGFMKQFTMKNLKKDFERMYLGGDAKIKREKDVRGVKAPTPLTKRYNKPK